MARYDLTGALRVEVSVKYPRSAGELHIQQRLGEAKPDASNFGKAGIHALALQCITEGLDHLNATGGLSA